MCPQNSLSCAVLWERACPRRERPDSWHRLSRCSRARPLPHRSYMPLPYTGRARNLRPCHISPVCSGSCCSPA
ncbi:hypothetical protein B7H19_02725 [Pseudomonas putida]|nr:hypothetical protein B7H19_02725 [Pseudomonas putida]